MAKRSSSGLRWVLLLVVAEIAALVAIYYLRWPMSAPVRPPEHFTPVQTLNLQSLIQAKGYPCPRPPALRYEQHEQGVRIVATCALPNGGAGRYEIDFKGHVRPL